MNAADWFILAVLILSTLLGLVRGFLRETIALLGWLAGLWLAWKFAYLVEPYLGGVLTQPNVRVWVARLIILFVVLLVCSLIGVVLSYFVQHSPFGTIDRSFGALFGLLRGIVMVGLGVIAGQLLQLDTATWWQSSKLMPAAQVLGEWLRQLVEALTPAVRGAV